MKNMKKVGKIAKAFLSETPSEESWYKQRLEACSSCEYNTDNIEDDKVTMADKLKMKIPSCNRVCTACGCCIDQKASLKEEVCGLKDLGKEPKWEALTTIKSLDNSLVFTTTSNIEVETKQTMVSFSVSTSDNVVKIPVNVFDANTKDFEILNVKPSCGCTVADPIKVKEGSYDLNFSISTNGFRLNTETSKYAEVKYRRGNSVLFFSVKLNITKND